MTRYIDADVAIKKILDIMDELHRSYTDKHNNIISRHFHTIQTQPQLLCQKE